MLKMEVYFDETGHGNDANTRILGIAGCLTATELWKKVDKQWENALRSENLAYFHMREFAHSQGIFKDWKNDEVRRRKIYGKLWEIISNAGIMPLGCFVPLQDFKKELQGQDHHVLKDAYFLCFMGCLKIIEQMIGFQPVVDVATFFDDKKDFRGEAYNIYNVLKERFQGKILSPEFRNMRDCAPLQIADIIAYESKKEFERKLDNCSVEPRWGFCRLEQMIKRLTPVEKDISFGSKDCSIGLLSKEEMVHVSNEQKRVYEEE